MSDNRRDERENSNPIGTMLGATFGPFGAAVGSVVDENRFAFKFSVGTNADDGRDNGMDNATTIEIEDSEEISNDEDAETTTDDEESESEEAENESA